MKVFLDTNIFVSILNKEENAESCKIILENIESGNLKGIVSVITISEVLVGMFKNEDILAAKRFKAMVASLFDVIKVNLEVAEQAALLRSNTDVKLPDAMIIVSFNLSEADYLITEDKSIISVDSTKIFTPKHFTDNYL